MSATFLSTRPLHDLAHLRSVGGQVRSIEWLKSIEELSRFSDLKHDWDGQGAEAPCKEVVTAAVGLAEELRKEGLAPPSRVMPSVTGAVSLEWRDETTSLEVEVISAKQADCYLSRPGMERAEHFSVTLAG